MIVYLGRNIFAPSMAYVALSRVKSLDGLEIDDIDPTKLIDSNLCNPKALAKMNRLRQLPKYNVCYSFNINFFNFVKFCVAFFFCLILCFCD